MVMAKQQQQQHGKGSPKQGRNEPAPFRFEHHCNCGDGRRQADDGSNGAGPAGPLHLTLGPVGSPTDRRCSCGVAPAVPAAPVTMAVLRGSRYLRPAQELLGDVVRVADLSAGEDEDEDQAAERLEGGGRHWSVRRATGNDGDGVEAKLLGLLTELESRRELYFGELGRVVSSFEPALGDGAAAAYTSLMARAMARHFGNLRRAILRRLRLHAAAAARRSLRRGCEEEHGDDDEDDDEEVTEELVERVARRTKLAAAARAEQASWRPIRGLPDGSVAVLRAWLFDHFLHPYPDDGEKLRLAVTTGLSRRQISNWFINARVRLWKPMIEDEFSEGSAVSRDDDASASSSS